MAKTRPRQYPPVCCGGSVVVNDIVQGNGRNPSPPVENIELREDGGMELREDGGREIRQPNN